MKQTKKQILAGVEAADAKIVANNTVEYTNADGNRVIRLHNQDILEFFPDGSIRFDSGGWKTITTKDRMNWFQNQVRIFQDKGLWWVGRKSEKLPFFDGMITKDGQIQNQIQLADERRIIQLISEYGTLVREMSEFPTPSSGDCWYCLFQTQNGTTSWGDATSNTDHLISHLEEKYVFGSLLVNAMRAQGYQDAAVRLYLYSADFRSPDTVARAVRKYFKKALGLAR